MRLTACHLLEADRASPADLAVAVVALCEAVTQRLKLPPVGPLLLWQALERSPHATWASTAAAALGEVADAPLVRRVIDVAVDATKALLLREAALDVLSGRGAVQHVTNDDLHQMADAVEHPRLVRACVNVIDAVAPHRSVPVETIATVVASWWERNDVHVRIAALDLHRHLPDEDAQQLVLRGLADGDHRVRAFAVLQIEEAFGAVQARDLVEVFLAAETHDLPHTELLRLRSELGDAA